MRQNQEKEDLELTVVSVSVDLYCMIYLKKTCDEVATNFEARKSARLQEIEAISLTIVILTADDAPVLATIVELDAFTNVKKRPSAI